MKHIVTHRVEIITKTTFGHGDSQTEIKAICKDCKAESKIIVQLFWPATHENMRKALTDLQNQEVK